MPACVMNNHGRDHPRPYADPFSIALPLSIRSWGGGWGAWGQSFDPQGWWFLQSGDARLIEDLLDLNDIGARG